VRRRTFTVAAVSVRWSSLARGRTSVITLISVTSDSQRVARSARL
jgi:hypothetical protein